MISERDGPRTESVFTTPAPTSTSTSANSSDSIFFTAKDCDDIKNQGYSKNGVFRINPNPTCTSKSSFKVVCDLESSCGGWTVIQRRFDGSVDFYKGWNDYEDGFGSLTGEYWLGLEKLHRLTRNGDWTLRVELEDFYGNVTYAEYSDFSIGDNSTYYRLSFEEYRGIAGDSLKYYADAAFSTFDEDRDTKNKFNCAQYFQGAWWYGRGCRDNYYGYANLNGPYFDIPKLYTPAMTWNTWKIAEALKKSEMKIRRINW